MADWPLHVPMKLLYMSYSLECLHPMMDGEIWDHFAYEFDHAFMNDLNNKAYIP